MSSTLLREDVWTAWGDKVWVPPDARAAPPEFDLITYTMRMNPRYRPSAVHYYLAAILERVYRGELDRVIITFPPRHGKTTLASIAFPAWCFGQDPSLNVIACSYAAALANTNSRKARNQIATPTYPYPTHLAGDRANVQQWATTGGGEYNAAGVGGSITGMGADILIIDDYVKNIAEADSIERRAKVWEWYTDTAYPRLQENGRVVIIGTRWHEDDLIGRLLAAQASRGGSGDDWLLIKLPALASPTPDEPDPLGREAGQPLWPEKYTRERLERRKGVMTSRQWQAQYQASPVAEEGGMFKRYNWRFWCYAEMPLPPVEVKLSDGTRWLCPVKPLPPRFDKQIQSWDFTFGGTEKQRAARKEAGSYVVGQVWGKQQQEAYLLDQMRHRWDFGDSVRAVKALTAKWPLAFKKLIEHKANGPAVINTLSGEISGMEPVDPEGGKEARAEAIAYIQEAGAVYLPHPMLHPWVQELVDEAAGFPAGTNDDQVDALSQALADMFIPQARGRVTSETYAQWHADPDDPWDDATDPRRNGHV
jgi:predicted phage terminase large subunit-like protein